MAHPKKKKLNKKFDGAYKNSCETRKCPGRQARLTYRAGKLALPQVCNQECSVYIFPRESGRPTRALPPHASVQAFGPDLVDTDEPLDDQPLCVSRKRKPSATDHSAVLPTIADANSSVRLWVTDDKDSPCLQSGLHWLIQGQRAEREEGTQP